MAKGKVTTNGANLMIRKNSSISSPIIGKIPDGTSITIAEIKTNEGWKWGKVSYKNVTGWACIQQPGSGGGTWIKITETDAPPKPTPAPPKPDPAKLDDGNEKYSEGLDTALNELMKTSVNKGSPLKASTRLFGMPFQFNHKVDPRVPEVSNILGRKYIENIVLEAPILTVIPGKPIYLPNSKNKKGTTSALFSAAGGNFNELASLGNNLSPDKLRYFDFQQDYIEYMKYVNILCRVAAGFLEIGDIKLDGEPLTRYNWMNYRFAADSYQSVASNIITETVDAAKGMVDTLLTHGAEAVKKATLGAIDLTGKDDSKKTNGKTQVQFDSPSDSGGVLEKLDTILANMNFVQFYIDPSSSVSESASNQTSTSKLEGIFDQGNDMIKEFSFLVNAGGIDHAEFSKFADSSMTALTDEISKRVTGNITGLLSRIISVGSNVIKGENVIIPEIYQRSDYGKSYSITINLHSPYNDRYSYYMNILVPMLHLLALTIPKQATPNTYASPFLIKAYLPGVFSCNLGIVEGISIDKNVSGEGLSVDGLPTEVKVTLNIKDLYSELMMTPSTDPLLFLSNSSLIDYLAVNCGVDLVMPQIQKKIDYLIDVVMASFDDIPENIKGEITKVVDKLVSGWTTIN